MMPAVANAVYDAVGVRIDEVPITPDKVLNALERKAKGEAARFGPERFPTSRIRTPMIVVPPWEGGDGSELKDAHGRTVRKPRSDRAARVGAAA